MHPNLPLWGKLVALSLGLAVLLAGFALTAVLGPMAGDGLASLGRAAMDRFGTWAGFALLLGFIGTLFLLAFYVTNREARKEYRQTRTITIEKKEKLPWAFKTMMGVYAAIFGVMMVVIVATGFH